MIFNSCKFPFILLACGVSINSIAQKNQRPNVILIITDDQGYGDLGYTGNSQIKTPIIDNFASKSLRFTNFYVSPVCAPTRSSLMTGRYSLRTGMRDTYNGGATMASNEITIAEMLKQANYKTGLFGKWHLGDNYPCRPMDQGFDETLMHLAGGMGQVGDVTTYFKKDSSYFDPVLWHNGKKESFSGYCSDIFTANAIKFIEKNKSNPFFCYLSFNAPHGPLQVPDRYYQMYKGIDPSVELEKNNPMHLKMTEQDKEDARKVYGMVTNIDFNIGKVLQKLKELGIEENTIVIFMTDNGPQQLRYTAGLRDKKGSVYDGGTRVPFFLKFPSLTNESKAIETIAAHIDVLPTLSELCHVDLPKDRKIDGKSLVPLIKGEKVDWSNRSLFTYWTRKYPELYNSMAIQKSGYKLVGQTDYNATIEQFELYNLKNDPYEQHNIVSGNIDIAKNLKKELDTIYQELILSENLTKQPLIVIGSEKENSLILNRNDADGTRGLWDQEEIFGKWIVHIMKGRYNFRFKFIKPIGANGQMYLETNTIINQMKNDLNTDVIEMKNVSLPEMDGELIPYYLVGSKSILPLWVEIEKVN
ncbi:MAG: arylsulfatase [Prolixibacteraceae bacterium]|nr:arylsulfatase [Prolixibacteraceae bacterium]